MGLPPFPVYLKKISLTFHWWEGCQESWWSLRRRV